MAEHAVDLGGRALQEVHGDEDEVALVLGRRNVLVRAEGGLAQLPGEVRDPVVRPHVRARIRHQVDGLVSRLNLTFDDVCMGGCGEEDPHAEEEHHRGGGGCCRCHICQCMFS